MDFKMLPHQCFEFSSVWFNKPCTPGFRNFLLFFSAGLSMKLDVGLDVDGLCHFQLLADMVRWVRAAGPLLNTHRVVAKLLLCCLGCGEPRPSLRLRALWARPSSKILLNSAVLNFPSTLPSALVAATDKTPPGWELPPPCFTSGMALGRR